MIFFGPDIPGASEGLLANCNVKVEQMTGQPRHTGINFYYDINIVLQSGRLRHGTIRSSQIHQYQMSMKRRSQTAASPGAEEAPAASDCLGLLSNNLQNIDLLQPLQQGAASTPEYNLPGIIRKADSRERNQHTISNHGLGEAGE